MDGWFAGIEPLQKNPFFLTGMGRHGYVNMASPIIPSSVGQSYSAMSLSPGRPVLQDPSQSPVDENSSRQSRQSRSALEFVMMLCEGYCSYIYQDDNNCSKAILASC